MHQIDFYILHTRLIRQEKERLACQLVDKAWHQDYHVYVHTDTQVSAQRLDMTLWTFKKESFLPHDIYPDVLSSAPIQIGYTEKVCEGMNVLINLTLSIPTFFEQFERIVEIVDDMPEARQAGRARYRFYKEKDYVLKVHDINR